MNAIKIYCDPIKTEVSMGKKLTNKRAVAGAFADAMNLLYEGENKYHQQVAYLAYRMAEELGFAEHERETVIMAALLHDCGMVILPENKEYPFRELAAAGLNLVGDINILQFVRRIFLAGQTEYKGEPAYESLSMEARYAAVIDLARRVPKMLKSNDAALNQMMDICDNISDLAGEELQVWAVECFLRVAKTDYYWMDILHQPEVVLSFLPAGNNMTDDELIELSFFMSRVIDFRSRYTAAHSVGVAVSAVRLAEILGMSEDECKMMLIAGYLHDVGKLKVPKAILEKGDKLTDAEFNLVKEYAYYTHLLLKEIPGFEQIGRWASLHHEKMNGFGYPFGLKADDIPMGARILAVADIFSAVTEVRAYRPSMEKEGVIRTLKESLDKGALPKGLVELMMQNYDDIFVKRDEEVAKELSRYLASSVENDEEDETEPEAAAEKTEASFEEEASEMPAYESDDESRDDSEDDVIEEEDVTKAEEAEAAMKNAPPVFDKDNDYAKAFMDEVNN